MCSPRTLGRVFLLAGVSRITTKVAIQARLVLTLVFDREMGAEGTGRESSGTRNRGAGHEEPG